MFLKEDMLNTILGWDSPGLPSNHGLHSAWKYLLPRNYSVPVILALGELQ